MATERNAILRSKRAEEVGTHPAWHLTLIILAVLILIVLISLIVVFEKKGAEEITSDYICKLSNRLKASLPFGEVRQLRPGTLPKLSKVCQTQFEKIDIESDEFWSGCDKKFRDLYYSSQDPAEGVKGCIAQNIAHYAWRCWNMNLKGTGDCESMICFNIEIQTALTGYYDNKKREASRLALRTELANNIKEDLACPRADLPYCSDLANELADIVMKMMVEDAMKEWYVEKINSYLSTCGAEDIQQEAVIDALSEETETIKYVMKSGFLQPDVTEIDINALAAAIADEVSLTDPSIQAIQELCAGKIIPDGTDSFVNLIIDWRASAEFILADKFNFGKKGCTFNKGNVNDALNDLIQHKKEFKNIMNEAADKVNSEISNEELKSIALQTTFKLGIEPPDLTPIDETYLDNIIETTNILGENRTYAVDIPSKKVEFVGGLEKLKRNQIIEIGFCDAERPLGTGVTPRRLCSYLTGREIQLGTGGRGVAGMVRTGSPYPKFCHAFELGLPVAKQIRDVCEVMVRGALRPIGTSLG